jgi:hypothetical protein
MSYTHYLITFTHQAIGVIAKDENDALQQGAAMGLADVIARVDEAMTQEEWDAATAPIEPVITVIYRIKDGDVYEIPVSGVDRLWKAIRVALDFRGLRLADVTLCL